MPKCDGISATIFIRSVNARVPIIAMTSNIRAEDMETYFHWGRSLTPRSHQDKTLLTAF